MNLQDQHFLVERLHNLVKRHATGTLEELAVKFDVGKSTMARYIAAFKDNYDAPIKYNRTKRYYYYTEPFELKIHLEIKRMS
jgi:transposase